MRTTGIWALALTTLIGSQSVSAADLPGKGIAVQPVQSTISEETFQTLLVSKALEKLGYKKPEHEGQGSGRLSLIHILLGMIPAVVLGLIFHDTIKSLFNPINVMYALIVGGVLLIAAEVLKPKQPRAVGIDDMTYRQAFVIGCFQCLALWPGFSRSGATISGGMLMGVSRYAASEFSFLLAVPMMMGATVLDMYKSIGFLNAGDIPMFAVGFITAFIVALIAIKTFLQLIKRISFIPFAIYRFIVAAAVYVVFF